jgi:MYXO-CTERM domain-containing protein
MACNLYTGIHLVADRGIICLSDCGVGRIEIEFFADTRFAEIHLFPCHQTKTAGQERKVSMTRVLATIMLMGSLPNTAYAVIKTLSAQTNETATCRGCQDGVGVCDADTTFDAMGTIGFTFHHAGGNTHEYGIDLACDADYTFYVRCEDSSGNANTTSTRIQFSIAPPGGTDGGLDGGGADADSVSGDPAGPGDPSSDLDGAASDEADISTDVSGGCSCRTGPGNSMLLWLLIAILLWLLPERLLHR